MKYLGEYFYIHNGEEIITRLSADENNHNVSFSYKKIDVSMFWFDGRKNKTHSMMNYLCNIIDRIKSQTDFETFKDYYNEIDYIKNEFILINNKVYKPKLIDNSNEMVSPCIAMSIEFQNDKILNDIKLVDDSNFNKYREIHTFTEKIKNEIKRKDLIPKDEYINKEETLKYEKYLKWLKDKNLYFYPND